MALSISLLQYFKSSSKFVFSFILEAINGDREIWTLFGIASKTQLNSPANSALKKAKQNQQHKIYLYLACKHWQILKEKFVC